MSDSLERVARGLSARPVFFAQGRRMLVVSKGGQLGLLAGLRSTVKGLELRLFVNDLTPTEDSTEADFEEASYPQYRRVTLDHWHAVRPSSDGHAILRHDPVIFASAGVSPVVPVYGVWIADNRGRLWWSERCGSVPYFLKDGEGDFSVIPQFVLRGITAP